LHSKSPEVSTGRFPEAGQIRGFVGLSFRRRELLEPHDFVDFRLLLTVVNWGIVKIHHHDWMRSGDFRVVYSQQGVFGDSKRFERLRFVGDFSALEVEAERVHGEVCVDDFDELKQRCGLGLGELATFPVRKRDGERHAVEKHAKTYN
jgi:hypothetical protein